MNWLQIFFIVAIAFVVFLAIREFFTWYWKLNEISAKQSTTIELLKEQNDLLSSNNELLRQFIDEFTNR
jgi:large-conductance mechanosensitive channel